MATIGIDRMNLLAHVFGQGNPETIRVPVGASVSGISPGTILRASVTSDCATKPAGTAIRMPMGLAEYSLATTGTATRGDLQPVTVIRPGDFYIGTILGAQTVFPIGQRSVLNRTDTTNGNYYAVVTTNITAANASVILYGLLSNWNTMKPGAFMLGRSTSNDSSGTLIRTMTYKGVSGDTNPRVVFTWASTIFAAA